MKKTIRKYTLWTLEKKEKEKKLILYESKAIKKYS